MNVWIVRWLKSVENGVETGQGMDTHTRITEVHCWQRHCSSLLSRTRLQSERFSVSLYGVEILLFNAKVSLCCLGYC